MKKFILGLTLLIMTCSVATIPVFAHPGHDHSEAQTAADAARGKEIDGASGLRVITDAEKALNEKRAAVEREVRTHIDKFRQSGDDLLQRLKAERQRVRTAEQRKEACQSRERGLQAKTATLARNAQRYQKRIDDVLDKVRAYREAYGGLTVENYDALVAAAMAAQAKSQVSADALAGLKPTIDCDSETVANDVAAFRIAAAQARTDIAAYKVAVKNLIAAVAAAKKQGAEGA
jgi:chromosome segregation ATPase